MVSSHFLKVERLKKTFYHGRSLKDFLQGRSGTPIHAVDGVDFEVEQGEIFGLIGESGSGKTTIARLLVLLESPSSGRIMYKDAVVTELRGQALKKYRRSVQIVFQDPFAVLDPRYSIQKTIMEPLIVHKIGSSKGERQKMVLERLEEVGLTPAEQFLNAHASTLSGGQRQRVAIARAIALQPDFLIADEPVSMLDLSVRASIMNLILELKKQMNLTCLLIAHELPVIRYMCDRVAVIYRGEIVERAFTEEIIRNPVHPYTRTLISAVPIADPVHKRKRVTAVRKHEGHLINCCKFYPRCRDALEMCEREKPKWRELEDGHFVACHCYR